MVPHQETVSVVWRDRNNHREKLSEAEKGGMEQPPPRKIPARPNNSIFISS
jgi:hypothetical protein